jgi:hypothetical protein
MNGGRTRGRFSLTLLTVMALGLIGLTACTDDPAAPNPSSTSAPSVSTGPTPTSTATPPAAPKARPTPKSAEAFVKYFWDVYNYSYQTLDPEPLRSISTPKCNFCLGVIDEIIESKKKGLTNEGGQLRTIVVAAPPGKIRAFIVVSSVLDQDSGRLLGPNKEVLKKSKELKAIDAKTRLELVDHAWRVAAVNIAQNNSRS